MWVQGRGEGGAPFSGLAALPLWSGAAEQPSSLPTPLPFSVFARVDCQCPTEPCPTATLHPLLGVTVITVGQARVPALPTVSPSTLRWF